MNAYGQISHTSLPEPPGSPIAQDTPELQVVMKRLAHLHDVLVAQSDRLSHTRDSLFGPRPQEVIKAPEPASGVLAAIGQQLDSLASLTSHFTDHASAFERIA